MIEKLKNFKRNILGLIIFVFLILLIVLVIVLSNSKINKLQAEVERLSNPIVVYEEATTEVDIKVITSEIKEIGELATIEYLYTDAAKFEDSAEFFGKEVPFSITTKSFIAKWEGSIKAGIDISKVNVEQKDMEIIIYIPKAEILSHEIISDSIETLDEKDGLFNPVTVEDVRIFDNISKNNMEERAIENGILDKATENAKNVITNLIYSKELENAGYTIRFEIIEEQ